MYSQVCVPFAVQTQGWFQAGEESFLKWQGGMILFLSLLTMFFLLLLLNSFAFLLKWKFPPPPHPLIGETTPKEVAVDHPLTDPGVSEKITSEKVVG